MVRHCDEKLNMAANNRLKVARVLKGMTQLQLADVDAELKRRIADVLQKTTFELFIA